jgi:hypothetical protein
LTIRSALSIVVFGCDWLEFDYPRFPRLSIAVSEEQTAAAFANRASSLRVCPTGHCADSFDGWPVVAGNDLAVQSHPRSSPSHGQSAVVAVIRFRR